MSHNYHIGDLHLGHRNIMKYREGITSVEENTEVCVDNILTTCNKRDVLWLHGDIFFTEESLKSLVEMRRFVCNIRLILGNHDFQYSNLTDCLKVLSDLKVPVYGLKKHKGFWLSHAPIHTDELRGHLNIHGHVHTQTIDDDRYVNVSVDNTNFKPVKLDDIKDGWRGCNKIKKEGEV